MSCDCLLAICALIFQKGSVKGSVQCLLVSCALVMAKNTQAEVLVELPPACGSPSNFREKLGALIGEAEAASLALTMRIDPLSNGKYRLVLTAPDWTRELEDAECPALFRAALVVVAASFEQKDAPLTSGASSANFALRTTEDGAANDRTDGSALQQESSRSQLEHVTKSDEAPKTSVAASARASAPAHWEGFAVLAGGAEAGLANKIRPTVSIGGGFRRGMWGANVDLRFNPRKEEWTSAYGVRFGAFGARIAGSLDPVEAFHLVFGVSLTGIQATGLGVSDPVSDQIFLPSIELEAQVQPWRSRYFGFDIALRGRYGLTTPRFEIEPETVVYELPRVGGALLFRGICFF